MDVDKLVGRRVRAWREQRGLTQDGLVAALAEHGAVYEVNKLSRLERGQQRVQVREWLELALALDVPPAALLTPLEEPEQTIELNGQRSLQLYMTFQWLTGLGDPGTPDNFHVGHAQRQGHARAPYRAYLRFYVTQQTFMQAHRNLERLRHWRDYAPPSVPEPPKAELEAARGEAERELMHAGRTFEGAVRELNGHGVPVPGLPLAALQDLAWSVNRRGTIGTWMDETGLTVFTIEEDDNGKA